MASSSARADELAIAPRRGIGPLLVLCALVLLVLCVASLKYGARPVTWSSLGHALTHPGDRSADGIVIWDKRMLRTVIGLIAGIALGIGGGLLQGLTRNPIADPGITGINAGASLAVVAAISALGVHSQFGYAIAALIGGGLAMAAVGALARTSALLGAIVLGGTAITALCSSLVAAILLTQQSTFDAVRFWQVGSLAGRGWSVVAVTGVVVAAGIALAVFFAPGLTALGFGDDVARGLGHNVGRVRLWASVAVVALCGGATAAIGPIAFLSLAAAYMARLFVGHDFRRILPVAGLLAPIILIGADIIGRMLLAPKEVPTGVVVAAIGAPAFIAVVRRRKQVLL